MSVFSRFEPRLQQAIVARLGWSSLRPVQEQAGAALLDGTNAVVLAPTAGGKTEAAIFPTLSQLMARPAIGVGAIYVAPIKALLNNQASRLGLYTEMVGLSRFVWHGDTSQHHRSRFLKQPTDLLLTTPESLEVMLVSQRVDKGALFGDLRVAVVDEVHALAGSDRGAHLMSLIERLVQVSKNDVQRVGLSATVGNPHAILAWLQGTSGRPGCVVDPPKQPGRRQVKVIHRPDFAHLAQDAAQLARGQKSLFFCQSRSVTEAVAEHMRRAGTTVFVHHSAVSREERELAEERFHRGSDACIVCTSTLELGIDVGDLDRVLQAEAPDTVNSFLQRMGRTGRREGQAANTTFFCETTEGILQAVALVELARSGWVESITVAGRCWPALIHQLLAMSLAGGGITLEEAWTHFSRVPDFRGIRRGELDRLVQWLLRTHALLLVSGRLVLGPKAERRFGRRNFMELFAVFSSPQTYTVQTAVGQPLGSLNQAFVDRLVEDVSAFLLGGRAWAVIRVQHEDRRVIVQPAPRGRQPTWGGFLPQFLGLEICQKILQMLTCDESFAYLGEGASEVLASHRDAMRDILGTDSDGDGVEVDDDEIRWWTFAGGRINATLRYALEAVGGGWKIIPDNFLLRIRGEDLDRQRFKEVLTRLRDIELWEDEKLWAGVAAALPNYRLSKFQTLMPPWVEREVVASYLLDVAGAWRWLSGALTSDLECVPSSVREPTDDDTKRLDRMARRPVSLPVLRREAGSSQTWVQTEAELHETVAALAGESIVGLDVETTLGSRALCLVQIASLKHTYLIDALEVPGLEPLTSLLSSRETKKIIHNASFERAVLGRYGLVLEQVVDTLDISRQRRGRGVEGGHSLRAVCARELGWQLDKSEQTSDWTRRPLSESQISYAALDAEVLLSLYQHFEGVRG